jgi:hypothetical protein
MVPVFGLCIVGLVWWTVDGRVSVIEASVIAAALFFMFYLTIQTPSEVTKIGIVLIVISVVAFLPYAQTQYERAAFQAIDVGRLERAHATLAQQPDNVVARIEIAQLLHDYGLRGHAIAIMEATLGALDETVDPTQNTSLRNLFSREAGKLKYWKLDASDPKYFEPLKCSACGESNPLTAIACARCRAPYLLDYARGEHLGKALIGKLLVGLALVASALAASVWALTGLTSPWDLISAAICMMVIAAILATLFRDRSRYRQSLPS